MAFAPGFEVDVFISYAHANDADGWVHEFEQVLRNRVAQFLPHGRGPAVWRDPRLTGFGDLWDTLDRNVQSSALLLSICSPAYVTSENCAREVELFMTSARAVPGIAPTSRVARLGIIPYADEPDRLAPFRTDVTHVYHFFEKRSDETINQFQPGTEAFKTAVDRVAQHVVEQLRAIHKALERAAARTEPTARPAIFVASSSKDQAADRTTLLNEFKEFEVLTIADGSYGRDELTALTNAALARAACSVHLLGDKPGPTVDEGDQPVTHLQFRLGRTHRRKGFTQIVWVPTTGGAGPHADFVNAIRAFEPEVWDRDTEVLTGTLDDLLRGVRGVLSRDPEITKVDPGGPLYLLCTKKDVEQDTGALMALRNSLFRAGVLPELPAFDVEPDVDLAELERGQIAQSRATIIYYGLGGDGWVKLQRNRLRSLLGQLNTQGRHLRALYVGAPPNGQKQAQYLGLGSTELPEAEGFPPLLVLGNAESFEPSQLQPLLDRLAPANP